MNDDDLRDQLEEWNISSDGMGLAITLCLKYGVEFIGQFIECTPYHARKEPEKFKDQIIVNNITKLLQLEKELESKFLFRSSNWNDITRAFCEIFNFHLVGDWVFDEDELISRLEKMDLIQIFTEDNDKDKCYIVTLGYKAKYDFEKLMREGYAKFLKDEDWWLSIKNN